MSQHARAHRHSLAAAVLLVAGLSVTLRANPAESDSEFERVVLPFVQQHCLRCHGPEEQEGGLRLDELSSDFIRGPSIDHWLEVVEKLNHDEMPPEDEAQRPAIELSIQIAEWLTARIQEGEAARMAALEPVSFHRLTREEYANTVQDLLGVSFDVGDPAGLNEDDNWLGFERIGSVLTLSASHVERYLAAAEAILAEAFPETAPELWTLQQSATDLLGGPEAYGAARYEELEASGDLDRIRIALWPGQQLRLEPSSGSIQAPGRYRVRAQVSGLRPVGGRAPHLEVHAESIDRLLFEKSVLAPEDRPIIIEFETHLPAGRHEFTVSNEVPGPSLLTRMRPVASKPFYSLEEGYLPWQLPLLDDDGDPLQPVLILDWIQWEGPLAPNSEIARADFARGEEADMDHVRVGLERFAERAFRRPLRVGEIESYLRLVESELAAGEDTLASVKASLLAMLCSKDFLYLVEGSATAEGSTLTDWELASRLSYFLWSTMPDDELFALARQGRLSDPEVLQAQVTRMVADSRSARFADAFPRQWLQLKRVGMFVPNRELYPEYDKFLERSMVRETTAFFEEVLNNNLPSSEFLVSDWTMVNARLARHYGIPGVTGDRFQRVSLDADQHRGGLLTQASVLSLTSDGNRHRPVHRGVWLSESIFGESPPPPPANVEPIEPNPIDSEKATIRMQLDAHKKDPQCASCHRKIDPLGFAFDNYDAIGRWRTEEVVSSGVGVNPEVDASGVLPDGRTFSNAAEFQQLLLADIDTFHSAFVEKLATFALRRTMTVDDRDELARIAKQSAAAEYRVVEIIEALVLSDLFRGR